jgi:SET domain-containing protein
MGLIIRSSDIHAAGCYTTSPYRRGAKLVEYTGPRITKRQGDRIYDDRPVTYLFGIEDETGGGDMVIDGHGMAMFINHSCEPNCVTEQDDNGRVWVIAVRDIRAGEELTYDYLLWDGDDDAPCHCGSPKCRGTMYSPEELEKRNRRAARKKKQVTKQGGRK